MHRPACLYDVMFFGSTPCFSTSIATLSTPPLVGPWVYSKSGCSNRRGYALQVSSHASGLIFSEIVLKLRTFAATCGWCPWGLRRLSCRRYFSEGLHRACCWSYTCCQDGFCTVEVAILTPHFCFYLSSLVCGGMLPRTGTRHRPWDTAQPAT